MLTKLPAWDLALGPSQYFLRAELVPRPLTKECKNTGEDQFNAIKKWLSQLKDMINGID